VGLMKIKALALATVSALVLSGCAVIGSSPNVAEPTEAPFTGLTVVSSTNVWGDIAKSVGGDRVQVISIIESFSQDPHSYEASARDQLAVNDADLVIANGGGYDSFMDALAAAAGQENIIFAYLPDELAEEDAKAKEDDGHNHDHDHDHADGNEHVWYDFHVVEDFANRLAAKLASLDPEYSADYSDNLIEFLDQIEILEDRVAQVSATVSGAKVISSEPVADYLLIELGLDNVTPSGFSEAIEEERDVSPKDLLEMQNLLKSGTVKLFVVNPQTGSVQVDGLVSLARQNQIPVVELSELLPPSTRYFEWMESNIASLEASLR
jgi:zinc/manganese transport system substrate-binding protein